MPKSKYNARYKDLKRKIESNEFACQELLPSENSLIQTYDCSRNTVRRAISCLVTEGYVQTIQGKGVRNIYRPAPQTTFTIGEIESFQESAIRNGKTASTKVLVFTELRIDESLSQQTGFPLGTYAYYLQRLHFLDHEPLIINHNYFRKDCVPGLTKEIAEDSIYHYLEHCLHTTIVNSRRIMTVEKITEIDEKYLALNSDEYNCMAVVSSYTYDSNGILFEFTQSRHRPDSFRFQDNAVRRAISL